MAKQPSLLDEALVDPAEIAGMVHADDPHTSRDAAAVLAPKRNALHAKVLLAFKVHGKMTDEDLERLPVFEGYGPSTIRKRRSELYQAGALVSYGDSRNSRGRPMLIWGLP